MLRAKSLKLSETGLQGFEVKFASQREMVELMLQFELFELEECVNGCKKVVTLCPHGTGR